MCAMSQSVAVSLTSCKPPRASCGRRPSSHRHLKSLCSASATSHVPQTASSIPQRRREVLTGLVLGAGLLGTRPTQADPEAPYTKTATGIVLQEISPGSGPAPQLGDIVLVDYVLRRANGYFIYSTVEGVSFQPKDLPVGPVAFTFGKDPTWIQGLQEVVGTMRQGGKLRALIPPRLGYQDCGADQPQPPTYATRRQLVNHCREPLLFEVALLRVTPAKSA